MRRFFPIICVVALLVSFGRMARAQSPMQTPAAAVTPWNGLVPSRISAPYETLVGNPMAQFITGSDTASSFGPNFPLRLPFDVEFLHIAYRAGDTIRIGIGGYVSFNRTATMGVSDYVLAPDPVYQAMIFPFWSDLQTHGANGQGIRYLSRVDPPTLDSILTIEWNVETITPPIGSGRFQLSIIKHPASSASTAAWTEFQCSYDPTSELSRTMPASLGAQIGAKAIGQPVGPPTSPAKIGDDDSYYLLMTPPASFPSPVAITRLPTRQVNGNPYTPDWYSTATLPSFPSPYFHSTPPDSGFRMKPVETDADVKLGRPPFGTGDGLYFNPGVPITLDFGVGNEGHTTIIGAPVRTDIYNGALHVDSAFVTIDTLRPHQSVTVTPTVDSLAPGRYRVVAIVTAAGDQNRDNDTMTYFIYVRPATDIMPVSIDVPVLGAVTTTRAATGTPIPITITVGGVGTSRADQIHYSYTVRDSSGLPVATGSGSSTAAIPDPDSTLQLTLGTWNPSVPGRYYLQVTASAQGDQIGANDTLKSVPSALDFTRGSTMPVSPQQTPIMVYAINDPAAGQPSLHPFAPKSGSTITGTSAVLATFINNGASDLTNITGHVRISSPSGVVYDSTISITSIPGGGGTRTFVFPALTPTTNGTYRASAWLSHSVTDLNHANDTAKWSFTASVPGGKIAVAGNAPEMIEISPNPAVDALTLRWNGAEPGTIRSVLTDLLGAPVKRFDWEPRGNGGTATIDLAGCPSGVYILRSETGTGTRMLTTVVIRR